MTMIKCPECGRDISDRAKICVGCGISKEDIQMILNEQKRQILIRDVQLQTVAKNLECSQIQIQSVSKMNTRLCCEVCGTVYWSEDSSCPKCKYPVYSVGKNVKSIKAELNTYRTKAGIQKKKKENPEEARLRSELNDQKKQMEALEARQRSELEKQIRELNDQKKRNETLERRIKELNDQKKRNEAQERQRSVLNAQSSRIATLKVGQNYKMGKYQGEDINWRVLAVENGKALLISEKGLDAKKYHSKVNAITWEHCDLRKWLNNEFLNSSFTDAEKSRIQKSKVTADINPKYSTNPGKNTEDYVFLLSIPEAEKYFMYDADRKAYPSETARNNGAYVDDSTKCCRWWLRSPGFNSSRAARVFGNGSVCYRGYSVINDYACVRPALWVHL